MKEDNKERIENVIAYPAYLKKSDRVRIFEIGNNPYGKSRVSEVDRNTGKEYSECSADYGCIDESFIPEVERYLMNSLRDRELIKPRIKGFKNTLHTKKIYR